MSDTSPATPRPNHPGHSLLSARRRAAVAGLDFADAYLVASAERTGIGVVASFDRAIDRVGTVRRAEPSAMC